MLKPSPLKHKKGDLGSHTPYVSEEDYHEKHGDGVTSLLDKIEEVDNISPTSTGTGEKINTGINPLQTTVNPVNLASKPEDNFFIDPEDFNKQYRPNYNPNPSETTKPLEVRLTEEKVKTDEAVIENKKELEATNLKKYGTKSPVLSFSNWHLNEDGETSMVDKLLDLHPDYTIEEAVAGDDVIFIKKPGDTEGIEIRLQTSWTDNAEHSQGYRQYLEYVGGKDVDKTLNNFHTKTTAKYKGATETDAEFYTKIKPISKGGYTPYKEINGIRYHGGVLPSVDGKRSTNPYRNTNGGEATPEQITMYEELKFIHELREKYGGVKGMAKETDSEIVAVSKVGGPVNNELITNVGEESGFDISGYEKFYNSQLNDAHEDYSSLLTKKFAEITAKHNIKLSEAQNEFLPEAKKQALEKFAPQIDALQKEEQAIIGKYQGLEMDKLREEIKNGEHKGKGENELQKIFKNRINTHLAGISGKYEKLNEDINKHLDDLYLDESKDPESKLGIVNEQINNEYLTAAKALETSYWDAWKPKGEIISKVQYDSIAERLQMGGFTRMTHDEKIKALTKQWNLLSAQLDNDMTEKELAKAKHEFGVLITKN